MDGKPTVTGGGVQLRELLLLNFYGYCHHITIIVAIFANYIYLNVYKQKEKMSLIYNTYFKFC